jgi:hypothetical protein
MFNAFYGEAVRQEKRDDKLLAAATEWMNTYAEGDRSITGSLALSKRHKAARRSNAKELRRDRIKKRHLENHNFEFGDYLFEEGSRGQSSGSHRGV